MQDQPQGMEYAYSSLAGGRELPGLDQEAAQMLLCFVVAASLHKLARTFLQHCGTAQSTWIFLGWERFRSKHSGLGAANRAVDGNQ